MPYERNEHHNVVPIVLAGLLFNIGITIGRAIDNPDGKVREAQIENAQLAEQLGHDQRAVGGLILDLEENTFSFKSSDPVTGVPETCTGKFTEHDNAATLSGTLACTQVVPQPAHS
jgi:hypothetical protein